MPQPKIRHGIKYTRGASIKLEHIRVGDDITFSVPDRTPVSGVVHRIMPLDPVRYGPNRKVAFLDKNGYVLNGYPDQAMDAKFTVTADKEAIKSENSRLLQRKLRRSKQFRNFRKKFVGTVYGDELSKYTSYLYVKVAEDYWIRMETGPRGSFQVDDELDDMYVYKSLLGQWDECYLRLPSPIFFGRSPEA